MGLVKEPKDIDFYFENRELTKEECRLISEYIKSQQSKRRKTLPYLLKKNKKVESL